MSDKKIGDATAGAVAVSNPAQLTGRFGKLPESPWAWRVSRETLKGPSAYWCGCSCGWLETGWPNYEIAKRSMDAHLSRAHGRPALTSEPAPQATPRKDSDE